MLDANRSARIVEHLERFDGSADFALIEGGGIRFARAPGRVEPFLTPYLPFVGPRYEPGRCLLYATAQNQTGNESKKSVWWRSCVGTGSAALFRLYYDPGKDKDGAESPFRSGPNEVTKLDHKRYSQFPTASCWPSPGYSTWCGRDRAIHNSTTSWRESRARIYSSSRSRKVREMPNHGPSPWEALINTFA
jgi:hypothetical protein